MPDDSSTAADSKKTDRNSRWYLKATARLVLWGAVGWFAVSWLDSARRPGSTSVASTLRELAMFLLAITAATAAHELGHLAASRLVGFRFALISVFPLSLRRGPHGWKVGRGRGMGQCLAYPTDARDLRRRSLVYFSGGVVGGFGFTAISAAALRLGVVPPGTFAEFLGWCFWIGLVVNAPSLIPFGGQSDGFCLNVLRRPGPQADQFIAAFTAQMLDMAGVRHRDVDRVLVDALTQPACTPLWHLMGQNAAYFVELDSGHLDAARTLLGRLWELTAESPSRPNVELELAYFVAAHEDDPAEARRHLDAAEGGGSPYARHLAEAAILLAEGQPTAALAVLDPARPGFVAIARGGTGMAQHMFDQFENLAARAGGASPAPAGGPCEPIPGR